MSPEQNSELFSLWPTNILKTRLDFTEAENQQLTEIGQDYFKINANSSTKFHHQGNAMSLMAQYRSPLLLRLLGHIEFQLGAYLSNFYPAVQMDELNIQYNTFVNHVDSNKQWSIPHYHLGNQLVATYYSQIEHGPEEEQGIGLPGAINFHDPRATHANWMIRTENKILSQNVSTGTLILFPGYVSHSTMPFFDSKSRKTALVTNIKFQKAADLSKERGFSKEEIMSFNFGNQN